MTPFNIAILASGSGSNAQKIVEYFQHKPWLKVVAIITNNPQAGVRERAEKLHIPVNIVDRARFYQPDALLAFLREQEVQLLVLAGFLWLIPQALIEAFPNQIINIHPALLPKYGGKGMYGMKVHEAVYANRELESGITIHYVNEAYDQGEIIFQKTCSLEATDSPDIIAHKVQALEHEYFPKVIEELAIKSVKNV